LGGNFLRATFEAFSSLWTNIILAGIWMNVALTFACSLMTKASNVPTTIDYLTSCYSLKSKLSVRLFLCALLFLVFNLDIWKFTDF
jgi:Zn-dependent protease